MKSLPRRSAENRVTDLHGLTGYGAVMKVRDYAAGIIEDFRLTAFRRQG